MRNPALCAVVALTASLAASASADSWAAPKPELYVDATGHFYVVIEPRDGGAAFTLYEGAPGAPSMEASKPKTRWEDPKPAKSRPDDRTLAKGMLEYTPLDSIVSSKGHGFAALETFGSVGYGDSVVLVSSAGVTVARKRLEELFTPAEISNFPASVSSIWWLANAWIDEEEKTAVVVSVNGGAKAISFETGRVQPLGSAALLRALIGDDHAARQASSGILSDGKHRESLPVLIALYEDAKTPPGVRLRAAVSLAAHGDKRGEHFFARAIEPSSKNWKEEGLTFDDRRYAVWRTRDFFGDEALPRLRKILESPLCMFSDEAAGAMAGFGERAVPVLIEVVRGKATVLARHSAIQTLESMEASAAVPALLKAARDPEKLVADAAIAAVAKLRTPEGWRGLGLLLEEGGPRDAQIAQQLFFSYSTAPVPGLIKALGRWPGGSKESDGILRTLQFITHEKFPADHGVWSRWYETKPKFNPAVFPRR